MVTAAAYYQSQQLRVHGCGFSAGGDSVAVSMSLPSSAEPSGLITPSHLHQPPQAL